MTPSSNTGMPSLQVHKDGDTWGTDVRVPRRMPAIILVRIQLVNDIANTYLYSYLIRFAVACFDASETLTVSTARQEPNAQR